MTTLLRATATTTVLVVVYYTLPFDGRLDGPGLFLLPLGLVGFCLLTWHEIASVVRSPTPRARAVEVLAIVVPLFVILFASTYYIMSKQNAAAFAATISNRTDSLYFTVTVFATVGFGDIVPVSQPARVLVTIQMVGDLVLIGAGVRVLSGAIRLGFGRQSREAGSDKVGRPPDSLE